ncbi:MAG: hypothetical protein ACRDTU_17950 [Micromonosporaceae bacterium]
MITAIAIGLAVLGAVCFAAAAYLQHDAVRRDRIRHAVRRPAWLAGLVLIGLGATLHGVALALAPLVLVQPIGVLALPLVAVLHVRGQAQARAQGTRLGVPTLAAIAATAVGVALFVTVAATVTTSGTPSPGGYVRACWFAGFAVIALVGVGIATVGRRRCLAYAAAAGVAFAQVSVLVRAIGQPLAAGTWQIPFVAPIGIVVALGVGGVLVQLGYASGPPAVVVACLTIVDPLVSVGVGIGLLGETSPVTAWILLAGAASALIAVAGTVALARHHPEVAARSSHRPSAEGDRPATAGSIRAVGTTDTARHTTSGPARPSLSGGTDRHTTSGLTGPGPSQALEPGSVRAS